MKIGMGGQGSGDTGVDDNEVYTGPASHDAYGGPARQEVRQHLGRDALGISGNSLRDYPVITGGNDHRLAPQGWAVGAENPCNLHR